MSSKSENNLLSIGQVVKATGVAEATLRAWERRYGFPQPQREPRGHRRYDHGQVERIQRVLRERERGISLPLAIEHASVDSHRTQSLFGALRARHPELAPLNIRKRALNRLAWAIEDESSSRAERGLLIGSFQKERFYRQSEERWRELVRGTAQAFVFADFGRASPASRGPIEIPIQPSEPIAAEWGLICFGSGHSACLLGWEPPGRNPPGDPAREFEVLLSVEPRVVRTAVEAATLIAETTHPKLARAANDTLEGLVDASPEDQLRLSSAITARALSETPVERRA